MSDEETTPAEIHAEAAEHFAVVIAQLFVTFGAENYLGFDVQVPTIGLCSVTVQREAGLTPTQKLRALEDQLAEVRAAAKERVKDAEREMCRWAAIAVAVERAVDAEGDAEAKLAKIKQALELR